MAPPLKHQSLLQELESLQHLLVPDAAAPEQLQQLPRPQQLEQPIPPTNPLTASPISTGNARPPSAKPARLHAELAAQLASMQTSLFETIDIPVISPSLRARNPFRTPAISAADPVADVAQERQALIADILERKIAAYRQQLLLELSHLDLATLKRYR